MLKKYGRIALVLVLAVGFILVTIYISKPSSSKGDGTFTFVLVDKAEIEVERKDYKFIKGESFWEIIKKNYEVKYDNGPYGVFLLEIDSLKSSNDYYLSLYVNDKYSSVGISSLMLVNEMVVTIRETKL